MQYEKEPKFMENPEWYYYDQEKGIFMLTDKAPQEAIDSYEKEYEWYYHPEKLGNQMPC